MKIEAVKVQRLYLQVANQLSEQIQSGNLQTNSRLPSERDLASRFGVSRPTIREAMIALEVSGLVEVRSGSGVYVKPQESQSSPSLLQDDSPGPIEILEARLHFEAEAAALAATRISLKDLEQLKDSLQALSQENDSSAGKEHADRAFHLLIAKACNNSAVLSTITWLWELRDDSQISQFFHDKLRKAGIKPVIADHQEIVDAIAAGDPERARQAMQQHLNRVMQVVLADDAAASK